MTGRTIDLFGRSTDQFLVPKRLVPRPVPHTANTRNDVFCLPPVVGKLLAELLDQRVDVVQLRLVTRRRGHANHATRHTASIHAVHHREILTMCRLVGNVLELLRGLGLRLLLLLWLLMLLGSGLSSSVSVKERAHPPGGCSQADAESRCRGR